MEVLKRTATNLLEWVFCFIVAAFAFVMILNASLLGLFYYGWLGFFTVWGLAVFSTVYFIFKL